jgi:hypothetical protein
MLTNKQAYFSRTDLSRLSAELNSSLDSSRSYAFSLTTETTMKSCYEWVTGKGLGLKSQKRATLNTTEFWSSRLKKKGRSGTSVTWMRAGNSHQI